MLTSSYDGNPAPPLPLMDYPPALNELIAFFECLPEPERRENLIHLAEAAKGYEPKADEYFDLKDIRKDQQCSDTVGIFLRLEEDDRVHLAIELGPKVQTLTRAMTTILCRGLEGCTVQQILAVTPDFVPRIVGENLVRLRSQTVFYVLARIKSAARALAEGLK